MSTTTPAEVAGTARRPHRRTRVLTIAGAATAALAVWVIAGPLAGGDLAVRAGSGVQHVGPASVLIVSALVGLAGWALLAALERFTPRARPIWTAVALVVLLLSLAGPLGGVSAVSTVALACMHVAVAAVLVPGLAGSAAATRGAGHE